MPHSLLANLMNHLAAVPPIWHVLWAGLACLSVALFVLTWTRWGQSKPMHKCAVLSLLAHVLLACFATTVRIVTSAESSPTRATIHVALLEGEEGTTDQTIAAEVVQPWEGLQRGPVSRPEAPQLERTQDVDEAPPIAFAEPLPLDEPIDERLQLPPLNPMQDDRSNKPEPAPVAAPNESPLQPADIELPERETTASPPEEPKLSTGDAAMSRQPESEPTAAESLDAWEKDWSQSSPAETPAEEASIATLLPRVDEPVLEAVSNDAFRAPQKRNDGVTPLIREASDAAPLAQPVQRTPAHAAPPPAQRLPERSFADGGGPRETSRERPSVYRHRHPDERARLVQDHGGTEESEASVRRALQWLARAQSANGRWDAVRHGAGRERAVYGHDRQGAGGRADTAMTGLALLAFLGAGHTQLEGQYQANVQRGLDFLIHIQAPDGNLAGDATLYARMYCHAMAAFALSEAYAMTGDAKLAAPVKRAIAYTVNSQHAAGGWRYRPGDPGDTSQLGWQLMTLRSAELAGVPVPEQTWRRAGEFLQSVSRGRAGGLAAYQPGTGVSRPMSAEAAYCKLLVAARFDRLAVMKATCEETAEYLRLEMPGEGKVNLYYWYYATLLLHLRQHEDPKALEDWRLWNESLQRTLLAGQQQSGPLAGSWGSDTVWGGYGGRVYSTALAALCLETYYRYLPFLEGPFDRTANRRGLLHQRAFDTPHSPGKIE